MPADSDDHRAIAEQEEDTALPFHSSVVHADGDGVCQSQLKPGSMVDGSALGREASVSGRGGAFQVDPAGMAAFDRARAAARHAAEGRAQMATDSSSALASFATTHGLWDAHRADATGSAVLSDAEEARLSEAAFRARLWSAELLLQRGERDGVLAQSECLVHLAGAREVLALCACRGGGWMLGELTRLCCDYAVRLRPGGQASVSVELLSLADAALRQAGASVFSAGKLSMNRSRLLRQLALSYIELNIPSSAAASAREAVRLDTRQSKSRAASLRVLVYVLSHPRVFALSGSLPPSAESVDDVRGAALELMAFTSVPVAMRLATCYALTRCSSQLEPVAFECLSALCGHVRGDPLEHREALHFRLTSFAHGRGEVLPGSSTEKALCEALVEVENVGGAELAGAAVAAIARAARSALHAGDAGAAVEWWRRALSLAEGEENRGETGVQLAFCLLRAGRCEDARAAAEDVLDTCTGSLGAVSLLLLDAARRGARGDVDRFFRQAHEHPAFPGRWSSKVGHALCARWGDGEWETALESLLDSVAGVQRQAAEADRCLLDRLRSARARVQLAVALRRPAGEIASFLGAVSKPFLDVYGAAKEKGEAHAEDADKGTAIAEAREAARVVCARAGALQDVHAWADCVVLFSAVKRLVECFGAPVLERACCATHLAVALVRCAATVKEEASVALGSSDVKGESGLDGYVSRSPVEMLRDALALVCETGRQLVSSGEDAKAVRLTSLLWILEAEVHSRLENEACTTEFLERTLANTRSSVGSCRPLLLPMSQAVSLDSAHGRSMCIHLLRLYLTLADADGVGIESVAKPQADGGGKMVAYQFVAFRELLGLLDTPAAQLPTFISAAGAVCASALDGATVSGSKLDDANAEHSCCSEADIVWLIAFAWRTASRLQLLAEHEGTREWAEAGLALVERCSVQGRHNGARRALQALQDHAERRVSQAARCVSQAGG